LAIFDEVSAATEITLGHQTSLLAELARQGLVRRSEESCTGWALIRALRDFFKYGATPSADERTAMHRTAATEYIKRGALADALRHLHAAGDHSKYAALLAKHGVTMVESGELDVV